MLQVIREIATQPFDTFAVTIGTAPTQLSTVLSFTKQDLIDSLIISVDAGAANNVFIGGQGVTITNGIELVAGAGPVLLEIVNQNQHYELQEPIIAIAETLQCAPNMPRQIPFVVWDLSQIYMVAAAATNVRIAPFRSVFI